MRAPACILVACALAACSSAPPAPDWQMNAKGALERSTSAYLEGNARVEAAEFARARAESARTGRADVVARVELTRCAARVASLDFSPCIGFDPLRSDAGAAERAYAEYLAGMLSAEAVPLLPPQHRAAAANPQAVSAIEDPLARLVSAGVAFRRSQATPTLVQMSVDTASAQGWRRPLLAWLGVQVLMAENAGDAAAAQSARRRMALVQGN